MATYYWVGGTGTWDNATNTNWSASSGGAGGAGVPTTADAVIFDANSNTGTNDFTVTLGTSPACLTMVTTGIDPATAMTVAGTGALSVAGATFTLTNKVSWTHTGSLTFSASVTGTKNITTAGVSLACSVNIAVSTTGVTYNFVDNFTTTNTFTLTRATLTSTGSNKTLTVASFLTSGTSAKTINLGASATINITGNNATIFDLATGTTITWTSPAAVGLTYSGSTGTRTVSLSGTVFAAQTLNVSAGSDTVALTASNALDTLNFTGFTGTWTNVAISVGTLTTPAGMTIGSGANAVTFNRTGTITANGLTYDFPVTISGSAITTTLSGNFTLGSTRTLTVTQGTFAIGANTVSVPALVSTGVSTRSITRSPGYAFNITGNASTILSLTASFSTTVIFDCTYSGSTGTRTVNSTYTSLNLNVTAGSDTFTFTNGNLTVSSGMTVGSGTSAVTVIGSGTWTTNGKTLDFPVTINASGQILTLGDALTLGSSRTFTLSQGTLALGANTLSTGIFTSSGTSTRTITRTSGNITLTGNAATVLTLTGSGATYGSGTAFTCNYAGSTGTRTFNVTATGPSISISAGSDIVVFTASNSVGALDFTGFSGSWTNVAMTMNSSLTLSSGMTVSAGANTVTFAGTGTVTSNGKTMDFPVTVNGASITLTLGDSMTVGSSRTTTLTQGTIALGANTLSTGIFTSSGTSTRAITRTSGNITATGSAATILTLTGSGATYGSGTAVTCNYSGSTGTRTINTTETGVSVTISAGSDTVTFTASNTVASLSFSGFTGTWSNVAITIKNDLTLGTGMTTGAGGNAVTFNPSTVLGSLLTSNGVTINFPVTVSTVYGLTLADNATLASTATFTLSQGGINLQSYTLSTGIFTSSGGLSRSILRTSGNITITGNATTILTVTGTNLSIGSGTVFTCNYSGSTGTRTITAGNSIDINITAGTDTVVFASSGSVGTLNFTGFSGTWSNASVILASLVVSTGMTVGSGTNTVTFNDNGSITSNGKTLDFPVTIDGGNRTVTLNDALTIGSTRVLTLTNGTLSNSGNYAVSTGTFSSSGSSTRTLALGSGTWTVSGAGASAWDCSTSTNLTVTGTGTISMTSASAKTFAGGSKTWPILQNAGAGALTISGSNTFTTITNSVQPTTFTFTAGTTQTVTNFNVSGTAGNLVTINSSSAGVQATLSKSTGTVSVTYCQIQDSNATGGAVWNATGAGNVNLGNNLGWIFGGATTGFLMFLLNP